MRHPFAALAFLALLLVLLVTSCGPSEKERRAAFMASCERSGFSVAQCLFLYGMKEDADTNANNAAAVAGVAVGMSAGRR